MLNWEGIHLNRLNGVLAGLICGAVVVVVVALSGCGTPSKVTYHNRDYVNPGMDTLKHLESEYGTLVPTGEKVNGLPVLDAKKSMNSGYETTVLILKKNDTTCEVYDLSGGP